MIRKIKIEENENQEEKDRIMKIKPEIEAIGLSLVCSSEEGTSRWELSKYGNGLIGKFKKLFGYGSNNIISYSDDTFEVLLRDNNLLEDVKKLSETLKEKGYNVRIIKDFLT